MLSLTTWLLVIIYQHGKRKGPEWALLILFLSLLPRLMRNARLSYCKVLRVHFNADEAETFAHGCLAGATTTHERVENYTAGRSHQAAKVRHEVGWLDGRVSIAFSSVFLAGFGAVEEPGRSAKQLSRLIASVVSQVGRPAA